MSISSSKSASSPEKRLDSAAAPIALRLEGESGPASAVSGPGAFAESLSEADPSARPQFGQTLWLPDSRVLQALQFTPHPPSPHPRSREFSWIPLPLPIAQFLGELETGELRAVSTGDGG
jgi:hypothetical protein